MTRDIDMAQIEKVIEGVSIPPQPTLLNEIKRVYPSIDKIAVLVNRDPSLSAALLKTVNSAIFGLSREITSVSQAVMLLGLNSVMNVVNGVMLRASVSKYAIDPAILEPFWQSTMDVAIVASSLARSTGKCTADQAYLLGLFHHCAMPLMIKKFANYLPTMQQARSAIQLFEEQHFRVDHGALGFAMMRSWQLEEDVLLAVKNHHDLVYIRTMEDKPCNDLIALLKMAEYIAAEHQALYNQPQSLEWPQIGANILEYCRLSETDFEDLSVEAQESLQEADLSMLNL